MADRMTVLLVDDELVYRKSAKRLVEHLGHECFVAADGRQALDLYQRVKPDAVLMDIIMPGMDGTEAAAALISRYVDAQIVFVSSLGAFPEGTPREIAEEMNIQPKPRTAEQMQAILDSLKPQPARDSAS